MGPALQKRAQCPGDCLICFCLCTCPLAICYLCKKKKKNVMEWDAAMREWMEAFNKEVLAERGIFMKTQSNCRVSHDENGKHRHVERWLAFALTEVDAAALGLEPHLSGDIENMNCCGGVDERECCMHP